MNKLDDKSRLAYLLLGNYISWMIEFKNAPAMVDTIYDHFQGALAMAASTELIGEDYYHCYLKAAENLHDRFCGGKK